MPAIAPFLVHAGGAGVRMLDVGLRGDEDFLLVHSVEDAAEWRNEITRFAITGEKVYHCLQDPSLTFSFDADCLAFEGLADAHPGQTVTAADINNLIPGAFGWDGASRIYVYRRPRRRRSAAQLATINFDIEVMGARFDTNYDNANNPLTWSDPSTVLTASPDVFTPVASIYGATFFWRRRAVLDYTAVYDPSDLFDIETVEFCQSLSSGASQPANLAAFLASVDSVGDTAENEIVEIFHVVTGEHWLEDTEGNQLPTILGVPTNPIDSQVLPNTAARWVAVWMPGGGPEHTIGYYFGAFLTTHNDSLIDNGSRELISLYDMKNAEWAYGP